MELYYKFKGLGNNKQEIFRWLETSWHTKILRQSSQNWDGGYTIAGLFGHGDAFVLRDPAGIRPAYYRDEEVVIITSERPAIQTAMNVPVERSRKSNLVTHWWFRQEWKITEEQQKPTTIVVLSNRFIFRGEVIQTFTRNEKELGRLLCQSTLQAVDYDLEGNTVLSFIPNTAEVAFYGMLSGMEDYLRDKKEKDQSPGWKSFGWKAEWNIVDSSARGKIAIKDAKLRTFITNDNDRSDMVTHVHDITYGTIRKGIDNPFVIDDSIVRGTTLKNSILRMLDRLGPSQNCHRFLPADSHRYPDCYGIDMARIGDLVAFRAAIELLEENNMEHIVDEVYQRCKEQLELGVNEMKNFVRMIYQPFTAEQISAKIAQLVRPADCQAEVQIIFRR